ncbi:MAG: type II secretion system GspH family protein [Gammaproteobacteria bacterium]|nr:type II secretion system GspH family protein [Gammaproteobacteria bacterium]
MNKIQSSAGFTLVELITVILILGILAATALPKFMDVTEQAHEAAVAGAGGGMGSAVALVHAQYVANGLLGAQDNVAGFGSDDVDVSTLGWPTDTSNSNVTTPNTARCVRIWNGLMQNPPTVAAGPVTTDVDYDAQVNGTECQYFYRGHTPVGTATDTGGAGSMSITYDLSNGDVTTDADNN